MATLDGLWWKKSGTDLANEIRDLSSKHRKNRYKKLTACRLLYLDLPYEHYGESDIGFFRPSRRSNYNLIQGAVDSTHAKIVTARPRPQIVTVAGNFKLRRRAKLRQRWIDGEFERLRAYERMSDMTRDALIYGTGCLKVYEKDGRVAIDRVWVGDLFVDPREERFDCVRSLYQVMAIDKAVLSQMFPGKKKGIAKAPAPEDDALFPDMHIHDAVAADLATVVEAWRLPSSKDEKGRRVLVCGDVVLVDEPWESEHFPFVFFRWARDPARFWGQGMVERGAGIQADLSDHTSTIQDAYEAFVPKLAIPTGAQVSAEVLDNEIGKAIYFEGGVPPTMLNSSPISPDFLRREDMISERFYRVLGVSEMSAGAVKPAGIDSGRGMLVYQDVETQRFLPQGREYEQCSVDLAYRIFSTADRIAMRGDTEALRVYGGKQALEIVDYIPKEEDEIYFVRVFPVAGLSKTLAGRIEEINDLRDMGAISDPQAMQRLLDLPDIEEFNDLSQAARDAADKQIDLCLDGEQGVPSTYMDLAYAIVRGDQEVNRAELDGAPEEILQLLRNFCGAARMMAAPPTEPEDIDLMGAPTEAPMSPMEPEPMDPMMAAGPGPQDVAPDAVPFQ